MVTLSSITTTSATANWGHVAGAIRYLVELAADSAGSSILQSATVFDPTVTFNFTGLTTSTNYWVRVTPRSASSGSGDLMLAYQSIWTPFTTT